MTFVALPNAKHSNFESGLWSSAHRPVFFMINEYLIKLYCSESPSLIENYIDALNDDKEVWDLHHRAEILPCGRFSQSDLKKFGLFWYRPASELIYLRHGEHTRLHNLGKHRSLATRKKIREAHLGKHLSDATKQQMSEAKRGNTYVRGKRWWNNGVKCVRAQECPEGFVPGRLKKKLEDLL